MVHELVEKLSNGLEYLDHCIIVDNYFLSILLFIELTSKEIHAINIVKTNCIGLLFISKI